MKKKTNLILFGIDSLRADHMSLYGYHRLTTPHIDRFAAGGTVFEHLFSPHIPTTPGYTSMFTGMDCFGTDVVALRHEGALGCPREDPRRGPRRRRATTPPASGSAATRPRAGSRSTSTSQGWGSWEKGRSPKAENLNAVTIPGAEAPGAPTRSRSSCSCGTWTRTRRTCRRARSSGCSTTATSSTRQHVAGPGLQVQAVLRLLPELVPAGLHGQGLHHRPVRRRGGLHGRVHRNIFATLESLGHRGGHAGGDRLRPRRDAPRPRLLTSTTTGCTTARCTSRWSSCTAGQDRGRAAVRGSLPDEGHHADHPRPDGRRRPDPASTAAACCR